MDSQTIKDIKAWKETELQTLENDEISERAKSYIRSKIEEFNPIGNRGTIYSDGTTLWINDEVKCIARVIGIDKVVHDMTTKHCDIMGIDIVIDD